MNSSSNLAILLGAPNSGKTTLYNWLTASHYSTVNYPGSTVEYCEGELAERFGGGLRVADSPGTYSLFPKSEDESVTQKLIFEKGPSMGLSGIVLVIDATQISRQLILAEQIQETALPFIIVLTMMDLVAKSGEKSQAKEDLLIKKLQQRYRCPVFGFSGILGGGLKEIVTATKALKLVSRVVAVQEWSEDKMEDKIESCENFTEEVFAQIKQNRDFSQRTVRLDKFLLHPIGGMFLFVMIMASLFGCVFWLAKPMMDLVGSLFSISSDWVISRSPESLWAQFVGNGLLMSMGAVMVFVPQIFILFLGIGLLGDSGYLSRAATLIDKPLSRMGLGGRSFVPLLSGFACAVPGILACRNINSPRDRKITLFILPLLTCSARLPVYALLISFLFYESSPLLPGFFLALIYLGSMVLGTLFAGLLNVLLPNADRGFFIMELPLYRRPILRSVFGQAFRRTKIYIKKAGLPIFLISTCIWTLSTFPNYQTPNGSERITNSYLGKMGQTIEPILAPMGVDWRVGVSLISAFAAREVFVSTLAIVFNVTGDQKEQVQNALVDKMRLAKNDQGHPLFTLVTVSGLMIFFMIAMQCMSTYAVVLRETNSMTFALTQLIGFNLLAYVFSVTWVQSLNFISQLHF